MNAKKTKRERKNAKAKNPQPNPQNKEGQPEILTKEQQQKLETEKLQQELETLLKDIREFVGDDNYIFRGENKIHDKISSKLYRYFKTISGRAELQKNNTTFDFNPIEKELKNQLGEKAQEINFAILEKFLKENILNQLAQKNNARLLVEHIQKEFILKDVQEYVGFENENRTLTKLQHYGGATNLIDFSHDLAVALFFACDGEPEEKGRLIVLSPNAEGVMPPDKNQNNRAIFQKSRFVQLYYGHIDEQKEKQNIEIFIIPKDIKPLLLTYVQNYFGIRTETIYPDLMGYIQNQEKHSEAYKQFFAGLIYSEDKNFAEAINCYTKAINLKPNFAEAYNSCGIAKMNLDPQDLKGAIADYNTTIKLNPNYAEAYSNRGAASYAAVYGDHVLYGKNIDNDIALALADFNKAIILKPSYAATYKNRGAVYENQDKYDLAIADYTQAIALGAGDTVTHSNRGDNYRKKGDNALAIADYTKALDMNPFYLYAYVNRGVVYDKNGDYDLALADSNKAIEIDPNNAVVYNNRGNSYNSKGEHGIAIDNYTKAIALDPDYAEAYANRGDTKKALKDKGAREDLKIALRLAKQQRNESLTNLILKLMASIPADSDS